MIPNVSLEFHELSVHENRFQNITYDISNYLNRFELKYDFKFSLFHNQDFSYFFQRSIIDDNQYNLIQPFAGNVIIWKCRWLLYLVQYCVIRRTIIACNYQPF